MVIYKYEGTISDYSIEEKARALGMHYDSECKALLGKDEKK